MKATPPSTSMAAPSTAPYTLGRYRTRTRAGRRYFLVSLAALIVLIPVMLGGSSGQHDARLDGPPREDDAVGVPRVDVDFSQSVRIWWDAHPLNPRSQHGIPIGAIPSPAPVINVQQEFAGNIQAAIDSLPETGGTLFLDPGVYEHNISLIGRSNVHLVSDGGATIVGGLRSSSSLETEANIAGSHLSLDYGWFADCLFFKNRPDHAACSNLVRNPARNIYFRNLVFDGDNTAQMAFFIRAMRDVVFDDVSFQRFFNPRKYHAGPVNSNATISNIWCRRCHFIGSQAYGWVMDGMQGGGVIESRFEPNFHSGSILFLTNDDYTADVDNDGVISLYEQRVTQYGIISENIFTFAHHSIDATSANTLIERNTVTDGARVFVNFDIRHANRQTRYHYYGNTIVSNWINAAAIAVDIGNPGTCIDRPGGTGPPPVNCSFHGDYMIRNNYVKSGVVDFVSASEDRLQGRIAVVNNCAGGVLWGSGAPCTLPSAPTPLQRGTRTPVATLGASADASPR